MSTAIDYSYHKVSPHRGAHRIWIENLLLERADFIAGATYTIEINSESRTCLLKLSESGETLPGHKKVSAATTGTPIVYICNKTISEVFGDHEKVMVEYFRKAIRISLHHVSKLSAERVKRFKSNLSKGTLDEGTFCFGVGMAALGLHEGFQRQGINIRSRWVLDREVKFLNAAIRNNPI